MTIEFDPRKDAKNQTIHGISLSQAEQFDWDTATMETDTRKNYGEERYIAVGPIGRRLHVMILYARRCRTRHQPPQSQ